MKKIIIIITILSLKLISCNNDDSTPQESSIVGRWQLTDVKYFTEGFDNTFTECDGMSTIEFTNNTIIANRYEEEPVIVDGISTDNVICVNNGPNTGQYTINGNVIVAEGDNENTKTIFEIKNDILLFTISNIENGDIRSIITYKRL